MGEREGEVNIGLDVTSGYVGNLHIIAPGKGFFFLLIHHSVTENRDINRPETQTGYLSRSVAFSVTCWVIMVSSYRHVLHDDPASISPR